MAPIEQAHNFLDAALSEMAVAVICADESQQVLLNEIYSKMLDVYTKLHEYVID